MSEPSQNQLRPVAGFEGLYSVSQSGGVWSHRRSTWLSPVATRNGYRKVHLRRNGNDRQVLVHRVVAEAWVINLRPTVNTIVNHRDGDKQNNCASNLEWCTYSENAVHAFQTGLRSATERQLMRASELGKSRRAFTPEQLATIRRRVADGERQINVAREFGISRGNMSGIINRRIYRDIF